MSKTAESAALPCARKAELERQMTAARSTAKALESAGEADIAILYAARVDLLLDEWASGRAEQPARRRARPSPRPQPGSR